MIAKAYRERTIERRNQVFNNAISFYQENKEMSFYYKATQMQVELQTIQRKLESETNKRFVDLSMTDTIYNLIVLGQGQRAAKIKSTFKVPDKR